MSASYVSVKQGPSGGVTATLYLTTSYVRNTPAGSNTVAVEFNYPLGVLCKTTGPVQLPTQACPAAMRAAAGQQCLALACQAAAPSRSDRYQVQAQWSVCPSTQPSCGVFDMDTSELTALTSSSGGPGPGGANVPDFVVPVTTVAAVFPTGAVEVGSVVATSVGNSISNSNSNDKVTLNVNDQSKAAGSGPSPAVIGIGAGVGLLLLGAIGFVVVRRRSQAKRSERRSQLYGVYDQQEPVRFEAPLPPPPPPASEKSASAIATPLSPVSSVKKNAAFNNAKPVQLAALERSPSVSSSSKSVKPVAEGNLVDASVGSGAKELSQQQMMQPPSVFMAPQQQQQIQQPFYGMPNQQQQLQSQQQQGQFAQPFNNAQYVQQPQYSQQPALFSPVVGAAPFAYPPGPQAGAYNPQQPQQHPGYYDANGNYHFYAQQ